MNRMVEEVIKNKLMLLVDFILEKNPSVSRERINHKIKELQFYDYTKPHILDIVQNKNMVLKAHKSRFGNYVLTGSNSTIYEDLNECKLVFDVTTKTVIGFEDKYGEILPLNPTLIEICHKYKLRYKLPLNLNIDEEDDDALIVDEIKGLGLNYAESDEDPENED